jgi:uncharacterized membrane protein YfcA
MVPLLYAFYAASPTTAGVPVVAAHATSLCVIAPTALLGAVRYGRQGGVVWPVAGAMGAGAAVAAVVFARAAPRIPGDLLRAGFALFLLVVSLRMVGSGGATMSTARGESAGVAPLAASGAAVGGLSALLGVGGGVVAIPLLHLVGRLGLRELAPTSLAVIAPAAAAGTLAYAFAGAEAMPAWSVGFVHVGAAVPLLAGSLALVGVGARLNRRVPDRALRYGFAALLGAAALRLLWGIAGGG